MILNTVCMSIIVMLKLLCDDARVDFLIKLIIINFVLSNWAII